ncbi:uncharacterized protein [Aegilops tauschii subsp. strangulata]
MNLSATIGFISGINECVTLWQWAKSSISSLHSRWSGSHDQILQDRVLQLESGLQALRDTLPVMHDLINKAEWGSHDDIVASLLLNLKDAVSDAEDLLDEFAWYEKKVQVEGNASQSPFIEFFDTVIQGNFNKLNDVQLRLNRLSSQLKNMGLHGVTQRFDKLVRPETTSLLNETKIFDLIIWICVSDDFDVKRLTKEVIQSCTRKEGTNDNLDSLQHALLKQVNNKRLLIVLDDMWDDALKENGQCWKRFCAPFRTVQEGSMMLVTTRCLKVTEGVRTMEPVKLEGLKDEVFWKFFKLCVFGSEGSDNDPELELIGRKIVPKLKGSPLAAKTLGRMLSMDLQASHWNFILESELWELRQEETDILPALRLSYMYLPFYLKQCFAFCAVYPKDYKFQKACLAEIWVAEGFVEPQGGFLIQDIGRRYFEDLVARSFFQKVSGGYVIHDLLHDMAQKVSEHNCFILRNKSDFDKVPQNVRHLYVLPSSDFDDSNLLTLCKYTKLRTLVCKKSLGKKTGFAMEHWCSKPPRMRVISCAFTNELPDTIGNWKHLRYLEISKACPLKGIPSTFRWLYNLQILYAKKCKLESLSIDFGKLISLQKIELHGLTLDSKSININEMHTIGNSLSLSVTDLTIEGNENISSLTHVLHPDCVPVIKKIRIENCKMLVVSAHFVRTRHTQSRHSIDLPPSPCRRRQSPLLASFSLPWAPPPVAATLPRTALLLRPRHTALLLRPRHPSRRSCFRPCISTLAVVDLRGASLYLDVCTLVKRNVLTECIVIWYMVFIMFDMEYGSATLEDIAEYDTVISQIFGSEEEGYNYYNAYARSNGFGVRKEELTRKSDTNIAFRRLYVYSKEGYRARKHFEKTKRVRTPRPLSRCGCGARMEIELRMDNGEWFVKDFLDEHNHPLAKPEQTTYIRSHRGLSDVQKADVIEYGIGGLRTHQIMEVMEKDSGGFSKVGFIPRDLYNFVAKYKKERIEGRDAEFVLRYMAARKDMDGEFFYKYTTDSEGHLLNIFWADAQSRIDYDAFGGVVIFDSTYRVNKYNLPFVPFIGVNHHRSTTVFGFGIVSAETEASFVWLLEAFLESTQQKHPRSVITDGDHAMAKAIAAVFPNTDHRLCSWHIEQNMIRHLRKKKLKDFRKFVYHIWDVDEFERRWVEFMVDYDISEKDAWIMTMYELRKKWSRAYTKDDPLERSAALIYTPVMFKKLLAKRVGM